MSRVTLSSLENLERSAVALFLGPDAERQWQEGAIAHEFLRKPAYHLESISNRYVTGELHQKGLISSEEAYSYLLYYGLINAYKCAALISGLPAVHGRESLSVLDFGGGPGACFGAFQGITPSLQYFNFEVNTSMRGVAELLLPKLARLGQDLIEVKAQLPSKTSFDIVICSNVFNEVPERDHDQVLQTLVQRLKPSGTLIIIETALRLATRKVMVVRDKAAREYHLTPLFPCTHQEPCPLLADSPEDWCHGEMRWVRPKLIEQFDLLLGFNKHRLKSATFAFARDATSIGGYRVIRPAERTKQGHSAVLCGSNYFGLVSLKKRERSDSNRSFTKCRSYEHLTFSPHLRLEIEKDDLVCLTPSPLDMSDEETSGS